MTGASERTVIFALDQTAEMRADRRHGGDADQLREYPEPTARQVNGLAGGKVLGRADRKTAVRLREDGWYGQLQCAGDGGDDCAEERPDARQSQEIAAFNRLLKAWDS